ncbi:MAG: hypothetical protein QXQ78_02790 [Candidatus Anstonellales archaeon]
MNYRVQLDLPIHPKRIISQSRIDEFWKSNRELKTASDILDIPPKVYIPFLYYNYYSLASDIIIREILSKYRSKRYLKLIDKIANTELEIYLDLYGINPNPIRAIDRKVSDIRTFIASRATIYVISSGYDDNGIIYSLDYRKDINSYRLIRDEELETRLSRIMRRTVPFRILFLRSPFRLRNAYGFSEELLSEFKILPGIVIENFDRITYLQLMSIVFHELFHIIYPKDPYLQMSVRDMGRIYHRIDVNRFSSRYYTGIEDHPHEGEIELAASIFSNVMVAEEFRRIHDLIKIKTDAIDFPEILDFIDYIGDRYGKGSRIREQEIE